LTLLLASLAWPQPQPVDTLVSPKYTPTAGDLQNSGPKASEVRLNDGTTCPQHRRDHDEDNAGVWSVTIGPLDSTVYIYTFNVDGVTMATR